MVYDAYAAGLLHAPEGIRICGYAVVVIIDKPAVYMGVYGNGVVFYAVGNTEYFSAACEQIIVAVSFSQSVDGTVREGAFLTEIFELAFASSDKSQRPVNELVGVFILP